MWISVAAAHLAALSRLHGCRPVAAGHLRHACWPHDGLQAVRCAVLLLREGSVASLHLGHRRRMRRCRSPGAGSGRGRLLLQARRHRRRLLLPRRGGGQRYLHARRVHEVRVGLLLLMLLPLVLALLRAQAGPQAAAASSGHHRSGHRWGGAEVGLRLEGTREALPCRRGQEGGQPHARLGPLAQPSRYMQGALFASSSQQRSGLRVLQLPAGTPRARACDEGVPRGLPGRPASGGVHIQHACSSTCSSLSKTGRCTRGPACRRRRSSYWQQQSGAECGS